MRPPRCNLSSRGWLILSVFASIALLFGILNVCLKGVIFRHIIASVWPIWPGTPTYSKWKDLPTPIFSSFYFFNVTNPVEVQKHGAVPILVEMGPYVYQEFHHKVKIQTHEENDTITYQQYRSYHFDARLTGNLSLDDLVTTLNAPAATLNSIASKQTKIVRGIIDVALGLIGEKLFVTKTVRQLMFDGYTDPILTDTKFLPSSLIPQKLDRFGYFYQRNGSDWVDGVFNMASGRTKLWEMGNIMRWNYTDSTTFFPGTCGRVDGAGDFFPPGKEAGGGGAEPRHLWSNDLCRPITLSPVKSNQHYPNKYNGIAGQWHMVLTSYWANKTVEPTNWCWNPKKEMPSGVFDASTCRFGAPILISAPHFYMGDPSYLAQVKGLAPDAQKHETGFLLEPGTGSVLRARARFQVNFNIEPISNIHLFSKIRPTVFPTMWSEALVDTPSSLTEQLFVLANLENILLGTGLAVAFLCGLCLICSLVSWRKIRNSQPSLADADQQAHQSAKRSDSQVPILNDSLLDEDLQPGGDQ